MGEGGKSEKHRRTTFGADDGVFLAFLLREGRKKKQFAFQLREVIEWGGSFCVVAKSLLCRDEARPTHLSFPRVSVKVKSPDTGEMITPYQKPAKLFARLFAKHSREGSWVLDVTGGSGKEMFQVRDDNHVKMIFLQEPRWWLVQWLDAIALSWTRTCTASEG